MIDRFHRNLLSGAAHAQEELLLEMAAYVLTHFTTEEELFQKYQYPGAQEHQEEHQAFRVEAHHLENRLKRGELVLSLELSQFLKQWVLDHVLESDMAYVPFLSQAIAQDQ